MQDSCSRIFDAVRRLWNEWPALLGEAAGDVAGRLLEYVELAEADPAQRALACAQILRLLRPYPAAYTRLQEEIAVESESVTRGAGPAAAAPEIVTRYTDITCPSRIWIKRERVSVIVRLTVRPPQASDVPSTVLPLRTDLPVMVSITAPNFELLSRREQPMAVLPDADCDAIAFDLRPLTVGMTSITLDFVQGGQPLTSTKWEVEITEHEVATQEMKLSQVVTFEPDTPPPDLLLYVSEDIISGRSHLRLTLYEEGIEAGRAFTPMLVHGNSLQSYTDTLFDDLTGLTDQAAALSAMPEEAAEVAAWRADMADAVRRLGQQLWWKLFPADFKEHYAGRREAWRGRTLLVVSDEPYIPWEIVWPYAHDWEDPQPWAGTLNTMRWLRRGAHSWRWPQLRHHLALGALAGLIPTSNLRYAPAERDFLHQWMESKQVRDVSPAQATYRAVRALVDAGGYDWLHVAGHGRLGTRMAARQGVIELDDGELSADDFLGHQPQRHIADRGAGFFLNACHSQRQDWGLTYLSGWAPQLLEFGASLVIAPLWSVNDEAAFAFAKAFYAALPAATVGEAVRSARQAARRNGDPSWLAYSVYAHPQARIALPAPGR